MAPFYNVFAILLGGKEEPFSICKNYNPEGSSHSLKFALELDPRYSSLLDAPTLFFFQMNSTKAGMYTLLPNPV